jgi:hypothetical protein
LKKVPGFGQVQLHVGNKRKNVKGCFAVGTDRETDKVTESTAAMDALLDVVEKDKTGKITVQVIGPPKTPRDPFQAQAVQ